MEHQVEVVAKARAAPAFPETHLLESGQAGWTPLLFAVNRFELGRCDIPDLLEQPLH